MSSKKASLEQPTLSSEMAKAPEAAANDTKMSDVHGHGKQLRRRLRLRLLRVIVILTLINADQLVINSNNSYDTDDDAYANNNNTDHTKIARRQNSARRTGTPTARYYVCSSSK